MYARVVRNVGAMIALLSLLTASTAAAGGAVRDIRTQSCIWLDAHELARLTRLELADADERIAVTFTCQDKAVTISMENAESGVRIERHVADACCDAVERERTLAILAAGLHRAAASLLSARTPSLTEVESKVAEAKAVEPQVVQPPVVVPGALAPRPGALAPQPRAWGVPSWPPGTVFPPAPGSPGGPPGGFAPGFGAPQAAWRDAADEPPEPDYPHQLGLDGQLRFFNLPSPVTTAGIAARYGYRVIPSVVIGGFAEAVLGSSQRRGGEVDIRVFQIGLSTAWRFVRVDPLSLSGRVSGALAIVQLEGKAKTEGFLADSVTGATGSAALGLVPSVRTGRAELGLPLELSILFRAPRGNAAVDESPVRVDGVAFGAGLSVSFGLGTPLKTATSSARDEPSGQEPWARRLP